MGLATLSEEWVDLRLDTRILEAIRDLKWDKPTPVQSACIPLALRGKDLSIQSRTGSGKTGAFVIPIVQRILAEREIRGKLGGQRPVALFLVPSVELCEQTVEATMEIAKYVKPRLVVENMVIGATLTANRVQAAHILVSTAALLAKHCRSGVITAATMQSVRYLVMDEADVLMSMAEMSVRVVQSVLPSGMQVLLASATLTEGVAAVRGQLLHNPVNIVLSTVADASPAAGAAVVEAGKPARGPLVESRIVLRDGQKRSMHQYYLVATDECHRHTLLYALYRMALIKGKTLIFVDTEEDTYKLQHFLEQLGIATLVYDANLPMNVRLDTLRRFQRGDIATLVCTDGTLESAEQLHLSLDADGADAGGAGKKGGGSSNVHSSRKRGRCYSRTGKADEDEAAAAMAPSALHRGIDFAQVRNVILFDGVEANSPIALARYTHRIGRAGRAGAAGIAIAFFTVPQAKKQLPLLREYCRSKGDSVAPFRQLQRTEAAKLQYRVDSVLNNVTRAATRKLRVATVAAELGRSSYLASHLTQRDNEALKRVVRRSSGRVKVERGLLDVPEYMKLSHVDDVQTYTRRVRANKTRAQTFRKLITKAPRDPLKSVVAKVKAARACRPGTERKSRKK